MKPSFDSTPEFQHFRAVMKKLIAVPKAELDEMVKAAKDQSPVVGFEGYSLGSRFGLHGRVADFAKLRTVS